MSTARPTRIPEYDDRIHAEVLDDLEIGEHGYKYRMLEGKVMPPYITPARYQLSRTLEIRHSDICFTSFPKSGSTWLAYIILLIIGEGEEPINSATLRSCLHWVASSWTYPRSRAELDSWPSPRIFKSHMPFPMAFGGDPLKNECKYLYIARNPKDVAVSYYWFERAKSWSGHYDGPWEHWLEMFLEGRVQRDDWFDHVLSWWCHQDAPNILFLKYEDLVEDLPREPKKIASFLGCPISEVTENEIAEQVSFEKMKRDPFSNMHEISEFRGFFRSGRVGSWKKQFSDIQSRQFDEIYVRRMAGSNLDFRFE